MECILCGKPVPTGTKSMRKICQEEGYDALIKITSERDLDKPVCDNCAPELEEQNEIEGGTTK